LTLAKEFLRVYRDSAGAVRCAPGRYYKARPALSASCAERTRKSRHAAAVRTLYNGFPQPISRKSPP